MTFAELVSAIKAGKVFEVAFKPEIENFETYAEPNMRCTISKAELMGSDPSIVKVVFNYEKFDEFNKQFESANYYDKNREPCLTAREAKMYKVSEENYFDAETPVSEIFEFLDSNSILLYSEYLALNAASELSYVAWLELKVKMLEDINKQ